MYDELTAEREKSISINMPGLMKDVYAWMAIALVVTGFSAWFVADNALLHPSRASQNRPLQRLPNQHPIGQMPVYWPTHSHLAADTLPNRQIPSLLYY